MAKNKKTEDVNETTAPLTHTALGVFKNETTGHWHLVKVKYNPDTLESGEVTLVKSEETNRESVNHRFKITAINEGLVS